MNKVMVVFDSHKNEITCKIVYYGPGRGGKTTNLEHIFRTFKKQVSGDMAAINTKGDRTLFFDFLPMELGKIKGCTIRVQLFTVPGQVQYNSTRKLVLRGADGIVFVADSMEVRREKNFESLNNLSDNLKEYSVSIFKFPIVLQYNKRDLDDQGIPLMPVKLMEQDLNRKLKVPSLTASAISGDNVRNTLQTSLGMTLKNIKRKLNWGA